MRALLVALGAAAVWFFLMDPLLRGDRAGGFFGKSPFDPSFRISHGQFGQWYYCTEKDLGLVVGWPGKPESFDRPVWMIVIRYPKADLQYSYSDKSNQNIQHWEIDYTITIKGLANVGEWQGHYAVSSKQPFELFQANETTYRAENGRVFLLDLTRETPTVLQLPEDPQAIFDKPVSASDPRIELKAALERLKAKYPEVKAFVES